jgi:CHAT domain-containing protein
MSTTAASLIRGISLWLISGVMALCAVAGDDRPLLPVIFDDDFRQSSANHYSIHDGVEWIGGRAILLQGGTLIRQAPTGGRMEIECDLDFGSPLSAGEIQEVRVGILHVKQYATVAALCRVREDRGIRWEAKIIAVTDDDQGRPQESVIRSFTLAGEMAPRSIWQFRYSWGVLEIAQGNRRLAIGDAGLGTILPVNGIVVQAVRGQATCRRLALRGDLPPPAPTAAELTRQRQLAPKYLAAAQRVSAFMKPGTIREALTAAEESVAVSEQLYGSEATQTLDERLRLALCASLLGDNKRAVGILEAVYEVRQRQQGSDHPKTARALRQLGECLQRVERFAESRSHFERALSVFDQVLGRAHAETSLTLQELVRVCDKLHQLNDAALYAGLSIDALQASAKDDRRGAMLEWQNAQSLFQQIHDYRAAHACAQAMIAVQGQEAGATGFQTAKLEAELAQLAAYCKFDERLFATVGPLAPLGPTKGSSNERRPFVHLGSLAIANSSRGAVEREYLSLGNVAWRDNQTILTAPARVAVARPEAFVVEFQFQIEPVHGAPLGSLRFGVLGNMFEMDVLLEPPVSPASESSLKLGCRMRQQNSVEERTLRTFSFKGGTEGRWSLKYGHGVLEVLRDGDRVALAALESRDYAAAMHGGFVEQRTGSAALSHLQIQFDRLQPSLVGEGSRSLWQEFDEVQPLSTRLFEMRDYAACLEPTRKAYEVSRQLVGDDALQTLGFRTREAMCNQQLLRFDAALEIFAEIVGRARAFYGSDHPDLAAALRNQALCHAARGDSRLAVNGFEEAAAIEARVLGDSHEQYARTEEALALALFTSGNMPEALDHYQIALAATQRAHGEESEAEAFVREQIADFQLHNAKPKQAREAIEEAIRLYTLVRGVESERTLNARQKLASIADREGDYLTARSILEDVIASFERMAGKEDRRTAVALTALANIVAHTGDHDFSARLCQRAAHIFAAQQTPSLHDHDALLGLGDAYAQLGEYDRCRAAYQSAVRSARRALGDSHPNLLLHQGRLGFFEVCHGDRATGERILEEVLSRQLEQRGKYHADTAVTLSDLALAASMRGDYLAAWQYQERVLAAYEQTYGAQDYRTLLQLRSLGDVVLKLGQKEEGLGHCRKAVESLRALLGERNPQVATSRSLLAHAEQGVGNWQAAHEQRIAALRANIDIARDLLPALPESEALLYVAKLCDARRETLNIPRVLHWQDKEVLDAQKPATLPHVDLTEVYRVVWETRALATRSISRSKTQTAQSAETRQLQDELMQVRSSLAQLLLSDKMQRTPDVRRQELTQLTDRKEQLQFKLVNASDAFRQQTAAQLATFEELMRHLPANAVLIDILQSRADRIQSQTIYEAFIVRPQTASPGYSLAWVELGDGGPIDKAVETWRSAGTRGIEPAESTKGIEQEQWQAAGGTIRKLVWQKLSPHLRGAKTILIVGEGSLARVPWNAIPGDQAGRLLIDDYAIATALFGQHLVELVQRPPATGSQLLAVGGVDYGSTLGPQQWKPLPQTAVEAATIASMFNQPTNTTLLRGTQPTEEKLRHLLPKSRYVHLATHGFFADSKLPTPLQLAGARGGLNLANLLSYDDGFQPAIRNPLALTGFVLAGANAVDDAAGQADGIFTGEEIDGLDLTGADLVVLSACDTGLGQTAASEGVLGLQRSFHLQGARTVVASLWKVDDDATRALMIEFYRNLWQRKLGKLEALRQAQLRMSRDYDLVRRTLPAAGQPAAASGKSIPPYYWASFVLSGDWR